ncbi:hypothetical protein GCM10009853_023790 [Glycomyces scopariae]|uniref:Excreted virulence factor EspC, type VII ESX diderm n=1 Tax=Glycomyces sambucus TaxID=380244 RepID=A0A1G9J382_9ACTN|nr:hypothetical protein [Glycomyces sambucus]SDL31791.1 hypothetical protein SAMN05216298_3384 [Glycomyces sambucus]
MTRIFDPEFVRRLGEGIDAKVVPVLESTDEVLPALSEIDRSLYTTVTLPMAAAYSLATSTVTESMAGAAECFRQMRDALDSCAQDMTDTDDACSKAFGGE